MERGPVSPAVAQLRARANAKSRIPCIDRGAPAPRGRRDRKPLKMVVVALVAAAVFGMSVLLISSPSTDVSPSPVPAKTSYTVHTTISINGDAQFNNTLYPSNGVVSGNGTVSNPYVIAGWDINASTAFGITIWGTSAYFVIRDCYVHSGWSGGTGNYGIYVANCVNGVVRNNTVVDCNCGISLQSSSDCTVSDNTCNYNENLGLYVMYMSHDNVISNNTCGFNNYYGMDLQESNDNIVSGNNCSNNQVLGHVSHLLEQRQRREQ